MRTRIDRGWDFGLNYGSGTIWQFGESLSCCCQGFNWEHKEMRKFGRSLISQVSRRAFMQGSAAAVGITFVGGANRAWCRGKAAERL